MASFLQKYLDTTLTTQGVTSGTPIIVAYSGGLDSQVLLHLLANSKNKAQLSAVHINHGLMPDAAQWSKHCQQTCLDLDIPLYIEEVVTDKRHPQGPEAAARDARYRALSKYVAAGTVLLTAHHQDDQAETMLLQLIRGAGVAGLAAMPLASEFDHARLIRPLLGITRQEIRDYARSKSLQWIEDQSNADKRYCRNYLRHKVMPVIRQRWPGMSQQLARSASHQAEAMELLKRLALQDLSACRLADAKLTNKGLLDLDKLLILDTLSLKNALRHFIASHGIPVPGDRQLNHIANQIRHNSTSGQQQISWSGGEVRIYRRILSVSRPQQAMDSTMCLLWNGAWNGARDDGGQLILPGSGFIMSADKVTGSGLSIKRLQQGPVTVRLRQGGELCRLPGRDHHHKLKKLFQEAGIPPWDRSRLPLIYVGEQLAAVADKWICAPFHAQTNEAGINIKLNPAPE